MDPHERFAEWLAGGAEGDPPRDVALHASTCDDCMRAISAFDSLQAIDPGAAPLPPLRTLDPDRAAPFGAVRIAVGSLAVVLLAASLSIGASSLLRPSDQVAEATATTGGSVLAGAPTPRSTERLPSPTPSGSPTTSQSASPSDAEESVAAAATLAPTLAPPAPTQAPPPPGTPQPTAPPPSVTAAPTTPAPTPSPTPEPTPSPTPEPTPSPDPTPTPQCSNGVDDDGDLLADFPLDLGCTGPDDDDETGP